MKPVRKTHHTPSLFNLAQSAPAGTRKTVLDAWNAGDIYAHRFDEIICDVPRKVKSVDDTLLWDDSIEDAFWHTFDYLFLCANNGITINPENFVFSRTSVDFAGLSITETSITPSVDMLQAIRDIPISQDITGACSWFGLVEQVAWAYCIKPEMTPFQYCSCPLATAPTCCREGWKLFFTGSHFTNSAESHYAPVEGKALAVADALDRCRMFVLGCPNLIVVVDHRTLLAILNERSLEAQLSTPDMDHIIVNAAIATLTEASHDGAISWSELQSTGAKDPTYVSLLQTVLDGFPWQRQNVPEILRPFWELRERLSTVNGVTLMDSRPVILAALHLRVLEVLHSAHQGIAGMKARARLSVYWPGLDKSLRNRLDTCHYCRVHAPSLPREPLTLAPPPSWRYDHVAVDYFDHAGKSYLVYSSAIFSPFGASPIVSALLVMQSNGRAELGVKAARRIIADCTGHDGSVDTDAVARAILQYRNTLISHINKSTAQLLFSRILRDHLPTHL
ncbi:uncharacterized protein [Penaeus vannamei]|uniref:uncharacterized protein n=1 Tax=Penaeus vannamei TaxID=6689 RepID=UPI00387FB124